MAGGEPGHDDKPPPPGLREGGKNLPHAGGVGRRRPLAVDVEPPGNGRRDVSGPRPWGRRQDHRVEIAVDDLPPCVLADKPAIRGAVELDADAAGEHRGCLGEVVGEQVAQCGDHDPGMQGRCLSRSARAPPAAADQAEADAVAAGGEQTAGRQASCRRCRRGERCRPERAGQKVAAAGPHGAGRAGHGGFSPGRGRGVMPRHVPRSQSIPGAVRLHCP